MNDLNECCVCFINTNEKTDCGHILCYDCFSKIQNNICPLCRAITNVNKFIPVIEEYRKTSYYKNYSVSNLGNVRNNITGEIVEQYLRNEHYYVDILDNKNQNKWCRIDRLVAVAFVHNNKPNQQHYIHHKNFDNIDNTAENLEWFKKECNNQDNTGFFISNRNDFIFIKKL